MRVEHLVSLLVFAFALGLTLVTVARVRGFRLDDALIYARYVRNLYAGHGLVYTPGDHHNGVTSPLYVWVLAAASAFGHPAAAGVWLGGVCLAVTVGLVTFLVYPKEQSPLVGAFAGLGIASTGLNYTTLGMESALVVLLATLGLVLYRQRRWGALAVAIGLMGIARSELVFLAMPLVLGVYRSTGKLPWRLAVIATVTMLPAFAFNAWAYGAPLPDTLTAKIDQGRSGFWASGNAFLHGVPEILVGFHVGVGRTLLATGLAALCWLQRPKPFPFAIIASFVVLLLAFYTALSIPAYHWYLVPVMWALCLLAPLGAAALVDATVGRLPELKGLVTAALGALAAVLLMANAETMANLPTTPHASYLRIGKWMRAHLPRGSTVGAAEVGHVGWYSELPIIDLCGLVTPKTAAFLAKGDVDAWIKEYRPDYLLVHEPVWPMEAGAQRALLRGDYAFEPRFHEPGFSLLQRAQPVSLGMATGSLLGVVKRNDNYVREGIFTAGGIPKAGLFMHPVTQERFTLPAGERYHFRASLAVTPPEGASNKSDGVTFVVAQKREEQVYILYQEHMLPGAWHDIDLPLAGGGELLLRTDPGASGDSSYDWAVWGEPRLQPR